MNSAEIVPGQVYGYRRSPRSREAPVRIEALEPVKVSRGKWRVKFLDDPYPGLIEYVRAATIIAPWADIPALLRFEAKLDRLREESNHQWPGRDDPLAEAVDEVLASTGEDVYVRNDGLLEGRPPALERIASRARAELSLKGFLATAYGTALLPFAEAVRLVVAFAGAEPATVHTHIDVLQREYETEVAEAGRGYLEPLVNRWRAGWAVARQWAGRDAELAARDREIKRLRDIISQHIFDLRLHCLTCGAPGGLAAKLERALRGR
ncbi:MAG: hypothetical protein JW785_07505 [Acidimicrobiia bacterium]|nr:hypothetical protein [Acidimicrobiia bacterium]